MLCHFPEKCSLGSVLSSKNLSISPLFLTWNLRVLSPGSTSTSLIHLSPTSLFFLFFFPPSHSETTPLMVISDNHPVKHDGHFCPYLTQLLLNICLQMSTRCFKKHFPLLHNLVTLIQLYLYPFGIYHFSRVLAWSAPCSSPQSMVDCVRNAPVQSNPEMTGNYELTLGSSIKYWLARWQINTPTPFILKKENSEALAATVSHRIML